VLQAHGIACPRDSDQQLAAFHEVPFAARRRGDLVGFPGHVGILVDPDQLLHANAYHMTTLVEPLAAVVARLQPLHDKPVLGVVRPPCEDYGR
jgi:cell wall-associated NlpC family hydrolase